MKRSVSARGAWAAALACAAIVAFASACKKEDKAASAESKDEGKKGEGNKDEADKPAKDEAAVAAPIAPPPGATSLAAGTKDDFAALKIETAPAAAKPADDAPAAPKVDPTSISKEGIPTMAVKGFAGVEQSGFRVSYADTEVPLHQQFLAILKEVQLYEKIATGLNSTLVLPRTLDIQLIDCGTVNAFYDPNSNRIIMCNELMTYFAEMFKPTAKDDEELGNAILGAMIFAFFHEAGHGLIHQLDLATTGREEDAVDQFATIILIAGGDDAVKMALAGAYWFQLQSKGGNETPFYDEHAFVQQRFYNIMCWIYGSDPDKYAGFVTSGTLPEARAQRCPEEFAKTKKSWEKLLEPHLTKDGAENAEIAQEPPPAAETKAAEGHAITCEQAAEKAAMLIIEQVDGQLKGATQEEIDAAVEALKVQIPQVVEQLKTECAEKDWDDKARECIMGSKTIDAASACGV